jgi:hypothetical protein
MILSQATLGATSKIYPVTLLAVFQEVHLQLKGIQQDYLMIEDTAVAQAWVHL